jgi:hypothetical protein
MPFKLVGLLMLTTLLVEKRSGWSTLRPATLRRSRVLFERRLPCSRHSQVLALLNSRCRLVGAYMTWVVIRLEQAYVNTGGCTHLLGKGERVR